MQQAIRLLRDEGLVVSRQGSGVFVRKRTARAIALRPHVERAFEQSKVSIDFAGFSGETLHGAPQEPLDKIRVGQLVPESIEIRVLIITACRTGRTVTIVSSNSGAAIAAYLDDHRLTGYIKGIVARDDHDPERMKPDPYRVRQAVGILGAENSECPLVGDTPRRRPGRRRDHRPRRDQHEISRHPMHDTPCTALPN